MAEANAVYSALQWGPVEQIWADLSDVFGPFEEALVAINKAFQGEVRSIRRPRGTLGDTWRRAIRNSPEWCADRRFFTDGRSLLLTRRSSRDADAWLIPDGPEFWAVEDGWFVDLSIADAGEVWQSLRAEGPRALVSDADERDAWKDLPKAREPELRKFLQALHPCGENEARTIAERHFGMQITRQKIRACGRPKLKRGRPSSI